MGVYKKERNNMNQGEIAKNGRVNKQELEISDVKYEVTTDDDGLIDTVVTRRNSEQNDGVVVVGVSKRPVCEEIASNVPFVFIPREQYDLAKFSYTVYGNDNAYDPNRRIEGGIAEFYKGGKILKKVSFEKSNSSEGGQNIEDLQSTLELDDEERLLGKNPAELKD